MRDWNVVVSVHEGRFVRACQLLEQFGRLERTEYYNVLVMKVEDSSVFVTALADLVSTVPEEARQKKADMLRRAQEEDARRIGGADVEMSQGLKETLEALGYLK